MRTLNRVLSVLVGLLIWSGVTAAQCPIPDQLDGGPCCTPAGLQLPKFPNFNQSALEICWRNCNVDSVLSYSARWRNVSNLVVPCGERFMLLQLRTPGGVLHWTGTLRFQYSRTWMETDTAGLPLQVWRFLVNGDLRAALAGLPIPCPLPACAPAFGGSVRFTGYMDIAQNCAIATGPFQRAWMLSHVCDLVDHAPGFPRAGVFHPDRSYSFVGPAAGFVPGPLQPMEGTPGSLFEAMRRRNLLPVPATCDFEERLNHSLLPINQFCLCGTPTPQFLLGNLSVVGSCGSSVTTTGGPFLPGYLSMGIGSWTLPGVFPGVEAVRWNAGGYDYFDPCTGLLRQEVFFGATTLGGYPATQLLSGVPAIPLPPTFIDQSNSLVPPSGVGGTTMNVPYVSDHILNLNH